MKDVESGYIVATFFVEQFVFNLFLTGFKHCNIVAYSSYH